MKVYQNSNLEAWRLPKNYNEQVKRLKNIINININFKNHKSPAFVNLKKLIRTYGYKRTKNTLMYIDNNFTSEKVNVGDIIKTYHWEQSFRAFLKDVVEEIEVRFSNAILATLTWNNVFWTKKYPNFEIRELFKPENVKKVSWIFNQIRIRFWKYKEEILELENSDVTKIKLNDFFVWDLFDKATFGDLTIMFFSLKKQYKRQIIKSTWNMKKSINNKLIQEFESSIKFLKFLRNKTYHNEQLYSTNITKYLKNFNNTIKQKNLTSLDKITYALLYVFPKMHNEKINNKINSIRAQANNYKYITHIKNKRVLNYNMWGEKLKIQSN